MWIHNPAFMLCQILRHPVLILCTTRKQNLLSKWYQVVTHVNHNIPKAYFTLHILRKVKGLQTSGGPSALPVWIQCPPFETIKSIPNTHLYCLPLRCEGTWLGGELRQTYCMLADENTNWSGPTINPCPNNTSITVTWNERHCVLNYLAIYSTYCTKEKQYKHQSSEILAVCAGKPSVTGGFPA